MNSNEIITNDGVIEMTVEIAETDFGKSFKTAAGIGLAVLGGVITYRYVIKPLIGKIKAIKEQHAATGSSGGVNDVIYAEFKETE